MPVKSPLPAQFDHTGTPVGIPDNFYATWLGTRRELNDSPGLEVGAQRFLFCSAYLQALVDARVLDDRYYHFLKTEILEIWLTVRERLMCRGM